MNKDCCSARNCSGKGGIARRPRPDRWVRWARGRDVSACHCRAPVETDVDQVDYDQHVALIWHPRGRFDSIVIDPRISFGRPTIEGSGIPTKAIAARYAAGDDLEFLVYDFNLTQDQRKDALWFEANIRSAAGPSSSIEAWGARWLERMGEIGRDVHWLDDHFAQNAPRTKCG